jgi:hypothetical protein
MVWVKVAAIGWMEPIRRAGFRLEHLPFYSHTEVLIGSAIMLALCLMVPWRLHGADVDDRVRRTRWRATYLSRGWGYPRPSWMAFTTSSAARMMR